MSSLRDQLLAIRSEAGRLTPQIVVDAARPDAHPLHSKFEWDDSLAAEAHRRSQAADLIRSVRVTYLPVDEGSAPGSVRAFHATTRVDSDEVVHAYDPVEDILDDPLQRAILLKDMERDWKALRKRWESFKEFWEAVASDLAKTA